MLSLITIICSAVAGRCFSLFGREVGCLCESAISRAKSITHSHRDAAEVMTWVFVNWYFVCESDLVVISEAGAQFLSLWLTLINLPSSVLLENETGNDLINYKIISL